MRKIARDVLALYHARKSGTVGNTTVHVNPNGTGQVLLHGNEILRIYPSPRGNGVRVSLAGWDTVTTRSRINDLLRGLFPDAKRPPAVYHDKRMPYLRTLLGDGGGFKVHPEGWYVAGFLPR